VTNVDATKQVKVLVCDDDPTYLMLMRDTLEAEGFIVIDAADGEAALSKYFLYQPAIVLLDVQMPHLNGFEVCQQLRAHPSGKDLPILMVTGADDFSSIEKAYAVGATDFLPKPIKWPMIGHRIKYMLRSRDAVQDLKESEERLRFLAYYDPLTGLPNRQHFTEQLEKFMQLAQRGAYHVAIMFIDLDRFKRINDTLGHAFGDKLLKVVANKLTENLRQSDVLTRPQEHNLVPEISRLGGDEFTIFLSHVSSVNGAALVAQRLVDSLSAPIKIEQYEVVVTPSIGISFYPNDGDTVDTLLKNADAAMYHAKDSGRSCFKFYSDSLNAKAMEKLQLEGALRSALENDEFELYYQPQIDLKANQINSVEALIRWHHPDLGLVPPGEFIPIAEESGLIIDIGNWVLKTACTQAKLWLDSGLGPIRMAVNISGLQFKLPTFLETVKTVLDISQLPAKLLELELTETVVMSDVKENIGRLSALKELGISLAVDDFGTGYSSLNYLKRFPIDILKIDRSFITDIADDENDEAIVAAIMALAETMNLQVVAEGVENYNQLLKIKQSECAYVQGYYFSLPLDAQDCTQLLKVGLSDIS
tara:strand:+ start:106266 stop:108035 length:1770 start_codon:yes stop_codon:yes gene_type:complete